MARIHQSVEGEEPLSKRPLSVRLYAADDELVRAKGKQAGEFVRNAIRAALQQEGQAAQ